VLYLCTKTRAHKRIGMDDYQMNDLGEGTLVVCACVRVCVCACVCVCVIRWMTSAKVLYTHD
jgi:hypothetical protein